MSLAPEHAAKLSAKDRRIVRFSLIVMGVLGAGSLCGVAFSLYLLEHAPLLLIALSPLGRHFVLVAPQVDIVPFLAIGIGRRLAFYGACYFLGRSLGPVGLVWLEERARGFARWVRWVERWFNKAAHVVIVLMAGPTTSTLAGISKMSLPIFLGLASVSLFFRLIVMYEFAEVFREPIEEFLAVLEDYQLPGTILIIGALVAWQLFKQKREPGHPPE